MGLWRPGRPRKWPRILLWVLTVILIAAFIVLLVMQKTSFWLGAYCIYVPLAPVILGMLAALTWNTYRPVSIFYLVAMVLFIVFIVTQWKQLEMCYRVLYHWLKECWEARRKMG